MYPAYSVLLSVYAKESPAALKKSIESMVFQEIPPGEIILLCDGPLTPPLEETIALLKHRYPTLLQVHPFKENQGLGRALNKGILLCHHEYILRMDTDDFSLPFRSKLQLAAMMDNPRLVLVGGQIAEFEQGSTTPYGIKEVPLGDKEIRQFAKKRNPFNHMAVCYKKSAVLAAGNYQPMPLFEDYWLWMRLLQLGQGENIPQVVVHAAGGKEMLQRRGGTSYLSPLWNFQWTLYKKGYQSLGSTLIYGLGRSVVALLPKRLRGFVYTKILRK